MSVSRLAHIPAGSATIEGMLEIPGHATGLVLFAHGSGSSRQSPRNNYVAGVLRRYDSINSRFSPVRCNLVCRMANSSALDRYATAQYMYRYLCVLAPGQPIISLCSTRPASLIALSLILAMERLWLRFARTRRADVRPGMYAN